ncbi:hypothetical protein Megvenef_00339 [Candidatus Megaera venefica]|uniref:Uncharacterized protein n=1 Tax=Candidatus Megaera venefica TaxID=2055910 RepID=A0ABU5NB23_9RICK|nr:hypothetical protein [Candidatus Megaera venefica]MEA0970380.1 hypothetical protein [Candidatus Megaera venefica]
MKQKPIGRPEFHDGFNWFTLATVDDVNKAGEVDEDVYTLLQILNDEIL